MDKGSKIWLNGSLVDWDDAKIHVLTHALHYATAVFEGLRCYKTDRGPAIFRLYDHVWRLVNSAKIYLMDLQHTPDEIAAAIRTTVKANGFDECYIRPIAFYGYGEMGVNPLPNKVDFAVAAWRWGAYLGKDALKNGVRCLVSSWRRISPLTLPPQAKSSANYANAGLAKIEAVKAGYDEAILLNANGMVCEGTGENIFRVKRGALSTPPASAGILRGITRDTVIQLAGELGVDCRRIDMSREELYTSDELFLCGTAAEITPIREVDGRKIGNSEYPVTRKLQAAFDDAVRGRGKKRSDWLDYLA
ncbi:MAG: branched-chain amino acid transaminase [Candidatus Bathyarchaeia archaeon]|jgi:branched-chain amino acid aminotransferase